MSNLKRVYTFGNGKAEGKAEMKNLLGGKGANLAEMNLIGVPVPPGFTITTDTCNDYYQIGKDKVVEMLRPEVEAAIKGIEVLMKSKFGDVEKPASGIRTFGSKSLYAGYDGYHPKPRSERQSSGRYGKKDR